jgi:hypothetical protein
MARKKNRGGDPNPSLPDPPDPDRQADDVPAEIPPETPEGPEPGEDVNLAAAAAEEVVGKAPEFEPDGADEWPDEEPDDDDDDDDEDEFDDDEAEEEDEEEESSEEELRLKAKLRRVSEALALVRSCELRVQKFKTAHDRAKAELKEAQADLRMTEEEEVGDIRPSQDPDFRPLFDQPRKVPPPLTEFDVPPGPAREPGGIANTAAAAAAVALAPPEPEDDSWKKVSVNELDLSPRLVDILNDADIFTLGHLADWGAKPKGNKLTDIPGIGEFYEAKLEEAYASFWADWTRTIEDRRRAGAAPPPPDGFAAGPDGDDDAGDDGTEAA